MNEEKSDSNGLKKQQNEIESLATKSLEANNLEAQELHKQLESNLAEWNAVNEKLEMAILEAQDTNSKLIENLSNLNSSNQQLEQKSVENFSIQTSKPSMQDRQVATDDDIHLDKTELDRLSGENYSYSMRIEQLVRQIESQKNQLQIQESLINEQGFKNERLESEICALNKECVEAKIRAKEDLDTNLDEVIKREKDLYDQILAQSCESVRNEEYHKYTIICEQLKQK